MYHALVPLNEDGTLKEVTINNVTTSGKKLFDYIDLLVRKMFYCRIQNQEELDLMWYLWCGPDSPFFGKDKMTTLERVLIKDKKSHKEKKEQSSETERKKQLLLSVSRK